MAEKTYNITSLPFLMITQVVEGPNNLQKGVGGALSDTFVIMREKGYELKSALLDVGEEMSLSCREQCANSVGSNFLLHSDRTVDVQHLVQINIFKLNRVICLRLIRYCDGIRRRRTGCKSGGGIRNRNYELYKLA